MEDLYYSAIGILAIAIHLIINHTYYLKNDDRQIIKDYKNYLSIIFLYYLTDAAWGIFNYLGDIPLLYIDTFLYYVAMAFSVVLCCRYIISFLKLNNIFGKILNTFGIAFAFAEIVVLMFNHFFHIFFWFNEDGSYEAHTLRHIAIITQVLMFGTITITSLVAARKAQGDIRHRNTTICLFGLTMTLALTLQTLYPLLPLYSIGLLLGTLIIHSFIHIEEQNKQLIKIEELNSKMQEERKTLEKQKEEITTAFGIISGLTHDYHTIWIVDKATMSMKMLRQPGKGVIIDSVNKALQIDNADDAMAMYIDNYVCVEDKERMRRQVNTKVVLEKLSESDYYAVNFMRHKPDGTTNYDQMVFVNVKTDDGKQQFVFGFRDINDTLKQELEFRKQINDAKNAAEAANAAKTSFLFNMSHDIRTPMNAIMGFRDLLEKNQEDAEKRNNYLKKIEESSNVLLSIINNVLEMARIEKGVLELNESVWSIEQLCDTLHSVFAEMMEQKGLKYTYSIDVKHHYINCDSTKTREIFFNIVSNAYKYTKPGGKIHMEVKELESDKEGYAKYQIATSDTGIGMAEDFLPHIFEEFSRESNSTHSKIEGTGLGMPIVKRLVDFLGGTIEVKSKKGEGSTFIVTIDYLIADKSDLTQPEVETQEDNFEGKRILLAEDNELNAEIAVAILSELGFTIDVAIDGQECVEKLSNAAAGYYDFILMDIQMPRLNGYEATKAIRALDDKEKSQIKIVAMTANAFEEDKREAFKAGMNGHLAKPVNVRELVKTLTEINN